MNHPCQFIDLQTDTGDSSGLHSTVNCVLYIFSFILKVISHFLGWVIRIRQETNSLRKSVQSMNIEKLKLHHLTSYP